jgi:hypothetical protein
LLRTIIPLTLPELLFAGFVNVDAHDPLRTPPFVWAIVALSVPLSPPPVTVPALKVPEAFGRVVARVRLNVPDEQFVPMYDPVHVVT